MIPRLQFHCGRTVLLTGGADGEKTVLWPRFGLANSDLINPIPNSVVWRHGAMRGKPFVCKLPPPASAFDTIEQSHHHPHLYYFPGRAFRSLDLGDMGGLTGLCHMRHISPLQPASWSACRALLGYTELSARLHPTSMEKWTGFPSGSSPLLRLWRLYVRRECAFQDVLRDETGRGIKRMNEWFTGSKTDEQATSVG